MRTLLSQRLIRWRNRIRSSRNTTAASCGVIQCHCVPSLYFIHAAIKFPAASAPMGRERLVTVFAVRALGEKSHSLKIVANSSSTHTISRVKLSFQCVMRLQNIFVFSLCCRLNLVEDCMLSFYLWEYSTAFTYVHASHCFKTLHSFIVVVLTASCP